MGRQQHQGLGEIVLLEPYLLQDERDSRDLESAFIIMQMRKLSFREGTG